MDDLTPFFYRGSGGSELWWTHSMKGGWRAWFRIESVAGELTLVEVRVTPDQLPDTSTRPGTWTGGPDKAPQGGIPARLLRELKTADVINQARELTRSMESGKVADRRLLLDHGFIETTRDFAHPTGSRGHSDAFLLELAETYAQACADGHGQPATIVQEAMAKRNVFYARSTVEKLVRDARKRGFLTKPPPGRAGGGLTPLARGLIDEREAQATADEDYKRRRAQRVVMRHPETGGEATVSRFAYDEVWKAKGWRIARKVKETTR